MVVFCRGDKVFAKVRGYQAWPAIVIATAGETPKKVKYHVSFYGTSQTAVCKVEDIFPYEQFKEKYGKPNKKKQFNSALEEIENSSGLPLPLAKTGQDSLAYTTEAAGATTESLKETHTNTPMKHRRGVKRSSDVTSPTEVTNKRRKHGSLVNASNDNSEAEDIKNHINEVEPKITSHSRRKMNVKKFDEGNNESEIRSSQLRSNNVTDDKSRVDRVPTDFTGTEEESLACPSTSSVTKRKGSKRKPISKVESFKARTAFGLNPRAHLGEEYLNKMIALLPEADWKKNKP